MSFTDLERGLSTPPLSPRHENDKSSKRVLGPLATSIPNSRSSIGPSSNSFASISPPVKLPSGLQVTRGNSRDSIGLNLSDPLQGRPQQRPLHAPHPPPVSPTRAANTNSPLAQHSRFKQDNTRIDTPRPTLTSSTVAAAVNGAAAEFGSAPRSPHAVPYASQNSTSGSGQNRILVDYRPGDQDRRQVLSPPTSPPQFSSSFPSSLHQQQHQRGLDSRGPHDSGAFHTPSLDRNNNNNNNNNNNSDNDHNSNSNNNDTAINMDAGTTDASTTTDHDSASPDSSTTTIITTVPAPFSSPDQEHDYDLMVRHLSQQIFNISSNIAVLERLVPCLGQRHKDTVEMRASLHAVLDGTQDLVKSAHSLVKVLARYHQPPPSSSSTSTTSPIPIGIRAIPPRSLSDLSSWQRKVLGSRRQTHQRLTKDLAVVSKAFQDLQRQVVEAERRQVAALRRLSSSASMRRISGYRSDLMDLSPDEMESLGAAAAAAGQGYGSCSSSSSGHGTGGSNSNSNSNRGSNSSNNGGSKTAGGNITSGRGHDSYMHDRELSVQEEAMLREILVMDGELAFQESLLQEREFEIQKIEEGMGQVLDVMKELGTLVHEQRAGVDFLHDNIMQTRGRVHQAQHEILKASEHQRRSREKLCYLIMITSIVGAMVMLAFVST